MELNDALRRLFGHHRWLVLGCVILGLAVGTALDLSRARTYTASARLALDTEDPKTQPESAAVADIAKAIATTPSAVADALRAVHLSRVRDATDIATKDVDVTSLGSSGLVQLTVSDPDPEAAALIANALAKQVIATRLAVTQGGAASVGAKLDGKIAALSRRIATADTRIDQLTVQSAAAGSPQTANSVRAQRDEAQRERDFLAEQRAVLESERASLLSTGAQQPTPTVIGRATVPLHADPVMQKADIVLGGFLGLIIALGIAGLLETVRPTLVDVAAIGEALDAPVLGALTRRGEDALGIDGLVRVAGHIRLAAHTAGLRHVGLVPAGPGVDAGRLAEQLERALAATAGTPAPVRAGAWEVEPAEPAAAHQDVHVRVYRPESAASANGTRFGLVLVSPSPIGLRSLSDTQQLLRVSAAPLLGVVGIPA